MVITDAQFTGRTDHAVARLAVRLTSRDCKLSWKYRPWKRGDYEIALCKVAGTADDKTRCPFPAVQPHVANWLLKVGKFFNTYHFGNDEWTGKSRTLDLNILNFETDFHKGGLN